MSRKFMRCAGGRSAAGFFRHLVIELLLIHGVTSKSLTGRFAVSLYYNIRQNLECGNKNYL